MQAVPYRKRFFMSEESEKAAKWDMVLQLKAERSSLSVLHNEAEKIGKELVRFGSVLANPSWTFEITETNIQGKGTILNAGDMTIPLESLDQEKICKLINDINETPSNIKRLEAHVKDAGI
jgi:hypothetical protein